MIKYSTFNKFIESNELEFRYEEITQNMDSVENVDDALDVIFQYHRKRGFPHYNVPYTK